MWVNCWLITVAVQVKFNNYWNKQHPHQIIKYIPLVDMDGDEGLVLGPFYQLQIFSGHVNQGIKHIQKVLVSFGHNTSIMSGIR